MPATLTAISPRQLQTAAELLTIRRTALTELVGLVGSEARADRIGDVLYVNGQLERLAGRLGISPAELVSRAEAATEAEQN
jgi:hypothetical protein